MNTHLWSTQINKEIKVFLVRPEDPNSKLSTEAIMRDQEVGLCMVCWQCALPRGAVVLASWTPSGRTSSWHRTNHPTPVVVLASWTPSDRTTNGLIKNKGLPRVLRPRACSGLPEAPIGLIKRTAPIKKGQRQMTLMPSVYSCWI